MAWNLSIHPRSSYQQQQQPSLVCSCQQVQLWWRGNYPFTPGAAISSSSHLWFAAVSKDSFDGVENYPFTPGAAISSSSQFGLQLSARAALIAWKLSIHPRGSKRQQPSMLCSFNSGTILHPPQGQLSAAAAIFDLQLSARAALIAWKLSIHPRDSKRQQPSMYCSFDSRTILHSLQGQLSAGAVIFGLQLSARAALKAWQFPIHSRCSYQ